MGAPIASPSLFVYVLSWKLKQFCLIFSLFIDRISLIIVSCRLCFLQIVSMMLIRSLVGMFVYMFEISSDVNFSSGTKVICEISCISWNEF